MKNSTIIHLTSRPIYMPNRSRIRYTLAFSNYSLVILRFFSVLFVHSFNFSPSYRGRKGKAYPLIYTHFINDLPTKLFVTIYIFVTNDDLSTIDAQYDTHSSEQKEHNNFSDVEKSVQTEPPSI